MKTKIATDREQSLWLVKHGLNIQTADMFWEWDGERDNLWPGTEWAAPEVVTPSWSLTALLKLMPVRTRQGRFSMIRTGNHITEFRYGYGFNMKAYGAEEPVDAAVLMVAWLLKHQYIT